MTPLARRLLAEYLGSAFLAAVVIGSGIAASRLSPDDTGLALLENAAATAAGLFAIILMFGSVSGGRPPHGAYASSRSQAQVWPPVGRQWFTVSRAPLIAGRHRSPSAHEPSLLHGAAHVEPCTVTTQLSRPHWLASAHSTLVPATPWQLCGSGMLPRHSPPPPPPTSPVRNVA